MTKKRLFSEIEETFKPPTSDRFSASIQGAHSDLKKDPLTLKRAPLNHELLEELELLRLSYSGKEEEAPVAEAIRFLKDVKLPIFDSE